MRSKPTSPIWFAIYGLAFLAAILVTNLEVCAQSNETKPQSTEQQKLTEAQTKYYEAQAAKANEDRSTWQRLINLSAFLAAIVAVLSLVLNYSSTIRTQRDAQFLEALKRFGEDSPSVRASAAGLLAKLSNQRAVIFRWRRPNFDLVLDQLMAGLVLEENSVCVASIIDAVRHLATVRSVKVLERINATNLRVQKDMVRALAKHVATMVIDEKLAIEIGKHWISAAASTPYSEHVLNTLALRYRDDFREEVRSAIQEFNLVQGKARSLLIADRQKLLSLTAHRLSLSVEVCGELLKSRAGRRGFANVRLNRSFLAHVDLSFAKLHKIDFSHAQLQSADFRYADLQHANFNYANLQDANLQSTDLRQAYLVDTKLEGAKLDEAKMQQATLVSAKLQPLTLINADGTSIEKQTSLEKANLEGADLNYAVLQKAFAAGAIFKSAKLANAKLGGMIIKSKNPYLNHVMSFENSDWWAANFFLDEPYIFGREDKELLAFLATNYASPDMKDVHSSVQQFLKERKP